MRGFRSRERCNQPGKVTTRKWANHLSPAKQNLNRSHTSVVLFLALMIMTVASVDVATHVSGRGVYSCGDFSSTFNPSQSDLVQLTGNTILLIADQPDYGNLTNLGPADFCTIVWPEFGLHDPSNQTAVRLVENWIESFGATHVTFSNDSDFPYVWANMMVGQAEAMLNVQFNLYKYSGTTFWSNSADPWVPKAVAQALWGIWNLDNLSTEAIA